MSTPIYLGIDLGGTKTAVCLGDESGKIVRAERMATGADEDPRRWMDRLSNVVERIMKEENLSFADIPAIGLAVPGPMSVKRGLVVEPPNMPAWRDVPVRAWVEEMTGRPVHINNDANAAGLAEYRFGEFRGVPDLVYLTMSTGLGAGVISGGHIVQGADDLGGEVGHIVLDPDGPPCPCGRRGCLELYCGGRNVVNRVRARLADATPGVVHEEAGGSLADLTFSAIARAALRGDSVASEEWEQYLERLAHGVGTIAMCFNPSAIVMGTIAVHLGDILLKPLWRRLPKYAWRYQLQYLTIRPSALGAQIGELGALALALEPPPPSHLPDPSKFRV